MQHTPEITPEGQNAYQQLRPAMVNLLNRVKAGPLRLSDGSTIEYEQLPVRAGGALGSGVAELVVLKDSNGQRVESVRLSTSSVSDERNYIAASNGAEEGPRSKITNRAKNNPQDVAVVTQAIERMERLAAQSGQPSASTSDIEGHQSATQGAIKKGLTQ